MKKLLLSLFILSSCAGLKEKDTITSGLEEKTLKDEVSVSVVLMQAHAAYIRGCLIERHIQGHQKSFKYCKLKADDYLEEEVKSLLR